MPIVTLSRPAWRDLSAMAMGHAREGGGLLVGRRTIRGNVQIRHVTGMTHVRANRGAVKYMPDEIARAREAAFATYAPLEPIGEWHTHPHGACTADALIPQLSDDDFNEMLEKAIEIIVVTFPYPGYTLSKNPFTLRRQANDIVCRAEAWLKADGKPHPCPIRVR